jgi:hypothetical protein
MIGIKRVCRQSIDLIQGERIDSLAGFIHWMVPVAAKKWSLPQESCIETLDKVYNSSDSVSLAFQFSTGHKEPWIFWQAPIFCLRMTKSVSNSMCFAWSASWFMVFVQAAYARNW